MIIMVMIIFIMVITVLINVHYLDDACFMHVIAYRCTPNIELN
jgi:hypothetical protein